MSDQTFTPSFTPIASLSEIAARYDGYIVDLWGCLHDGVNAFPAAVAALGELKAQGKHVCFLSNGPRRVRTLLRRLDEMGVDRALYDAAMSSGEATWHALKTRPDAWHAALGTRCLHLGPPRDNDVREDNGLTIVETVEDAEFILNTGLSENDETIEQHEPLLRRGVERRLPMECANPDLVVHVGDQLSLCAGALAARYTDLGGDVTYHGKPHPLVYEECFRLLEGVPRTRLLGIGDGLRTDVAGANAAGIDSCLLTAGIHVEDLGTDQPSPRALEELVERIGPRPTWAMPRLAW